MAQAKPSSECRPRGRPQLRSDEETKQIVFEAARHAFAVDGYAATSTEELARGAGISTKTLYRLFPGKAVLFEAMCADRLERLLSAVDLQASDEVDIEVGLRAALLACADLALDPEVVALQRMVLQESAAFPELAANFYRNGISRTAAALARWLRVQVKKKLIALDDVERGRRHADRHGRIGAATRGDLWRPASAVTQADRASGADLRGSVPRRLPRSGGLASPFDNSVGLGYLLRMRTKAAGARHHRLIYLLSVAQRRLQRWMAAQPSSEVTPAQAGLLFILGKQDGVLMGEAGAALDLGPAGISGLVDRTAAAKLIERRADREDGRAWRVWLTPKGRTALAQAKANAAEVNAALTDGFTSAEIDIVTRWLTSIQEKFPRRLSREPSRDPEE
ncbi:DNA-binding MarR family transcriptional regulator/AcrR family transcriptional regulator [Bradyrhizobium sp. LM3.6]